MGFMTALAETSTTNLQSTLNSMTGAEGASLGLVTGMALGTMLAVGFGWFILMAIADWKIFTKAGESGWKSLIPIYNLYTEYSICWNGILGLIYGLLSCATMFIPTNNSSMVLTAISLVVTLVALALHIKESLLLARCFGKGTGFGIGLILLAPIFRLILGFGSAQYTGNRS